MLIPLHVIDSLLFTITSIVRSELLLLPTIHSKMVSFTTLRVLIKTHHLKMQYEIRLFFWYTNNFFFFLSNLWHSKVNKRDGYYSI